VHTAKGPKYRYLYGKTRAVVAEKLTKAMADRDSGLIFDAGKVTVGEYVDRWLADSIKSTVRSSTYERQEEIVRLHIKPSLGRVGCGAQEAHSGSRARAIQREARSGSLAPATVRKIHSTLHKALSQAVYEGMGPHNAADVKAPRPTPEEMRLLSEDEARTFLKAVSQSCERFEALYVLAISTGLRRGELLRLRWDAVDLERGALRVGRALVREGGRPTLGETKTKPGRRQINLTPRTGNALKAHRKNHL
jgi:integrase